MASNNNKNGLNEVVIIGGGFLFRDTLSISNKLVLTKVDCEFKGDVFYPDIDLSNWLEEDSKSFSKDADNDYDKEDDKDEEKEDR